MLAPTDYADRIGQSAVTALGETVRKANGIYLTPVPVARYMASRITTSGSSVRILDPAAGSGVLACAMVEHLVGLPTPPRTIRIVAFEITPELYRVLIRSLTHATEWAAQCGVEVRIETHCADYVLARASLPLFCGLASDKFDAVIANPPYFKLGSQDPRLVASRAHVPTQPNIYSLFMALSARELRPGGDLVFIVPRSFTSGVYFQPFRRDFFAMIQPCEIHLFDSRRQAFKRDAVLQENLIFHGQRVDAWSHQSPLAMSHSEGIDNLERSRRWLTTFDQIRDPRARGMLVRLPTSLEELELVRAIDNLPYTLASLHLSISTGPVVAFRARELIVDDPDQNTVPLLWLHHITPEGIRWPVPQRTGQYLRATKPRLLVPTQNCVVLRRFSAKDEPRRLTAAPLLARKMSAHATVGLENHLNYIYRDRRALNEPETLGLAGILNSSIMDQYFRSVSGNTQVGAAELRHLPLPSLETIARLGVTIQLGAASGEPVDQLILAEIDRSAMLSAG